ncbi:MAG: hypothetical protein WCR87_04835 [Saccharofermentanales bacterium]
MMRSTAPRSGKFHNSSVVILIICLMISATTTQVSGESYLYSYTNQGVIDVSAPPSYLTDKVHTSTSLGVELVQPEDMTTDKHGNFYICDAGANSIYVFDNGFKWIRTIDRFERPLLGEGTETFSKPEGIFVDDSGKLFVADTGNSRVVIMDQAGSNVTILKDPQIQTDILDDGFQFIPRKLLVDSSGRLFVLCKNVFDGILQFSESGKFIGFIGSNRVVPSAIELIWKKIMSEEQKGKLSSFVPVEYTNFSLDHQGFIYAVTSVMNVNSPIRRLNPSGNDVLVRNPINGSLEVAGDVLYVGYSNYSEVITGPSSFVDITNDDFGNYFVLDGKRGRVFGYDPDGNMLFVFGNIGTRQEGSFESPSAIQYIDGSIMVLDRTLCQVITFKPTEYAKLIQSAMQAYFDQRYEESVRLWKQILKRNSYFDLAYVKAGYGLYRLESYKEAMEYFKKANVKSGYSKAYQEYKNVWLNTHFDNIALSLLITAVILAITAIVHSRYVKLKKIRRKVPEGEERSV